MNRGRQDGEHDSARMVYRRSMAPVLAALLLAAASADGHIGEEPAPIASQATPQAAATTPAATAPEVAATPPADEAGEARADGITDEPLPLPEATDPQVPAKPTVPEQQLRILPQGSRMEAYSQFRNLYDTKRFDEALPYAKRVVELSETDPQRDHELPIAYNNLAATQYQLGDYEGATASYKASLDLLESTQGISSRRLIVPIAGLGAAYAAQDQHQIAADLFDRALAVSRRSDGLFNLQQLPLIELAAHSRYELRDFGGAERQRLYALKIAEQNFGYGDDRTLPPLIELAVFYESLREFIAARSMYLRARDVAMQRPGYNPMAIKALVGIARTHRLQYTMDPESLERQQPARDEVTGDVTSSAYLGSLMPSQGANRSGLKAAQTALELLRSTSDPPNDLLTETLLELGDWFQSTSHPADSLPYYTEAAGIFEAQTTADPLAGNPLKEPRMVFYRPPVSARLSVNARPGQYVVHRTVFTLLVSDTGLPQDVTIVSTDMDENQLSQSRRAVQKAIYSPRFAERKPVSTAGVMFTGEWYQELDPTKTPPAAPTPTATQEGTAEKPEKAEKTEKPSTAGT